MMHRRTFLRNTGLLTAAGLLPGLRSFSQLLHPYEYKLRMLRENLGIFTERGGTIAFLTTPDGQVVIDAQFPDTAAHLIEELKKKAEPIRFLLNTHHHGDHSGGNIAFKGIVEHVVAHANSQANQRAAAEKAKTLDKQLLPDITYTDDWKLKIGKEKIKALYNGPGHTNGDTVYHFEKANVMHMGDLMFNKRHPFVDRTTGANMTNWIEVLEKTYRKAEKDTIIIFGHSLNPGEETGNREDLMKFRNYLTQVLDFARSEIAKGTPKEVFIKYTAIPGNTEWSGQGIERPLTAAYEEMTAG
jgi:cyclase